VAVPAAIASTMVWRCQWQWQWSTGSASGTVAMPVPVPVPVPVGKWTAARASLIVFKKRKEKKDDFKGQMFDLWTLMYQAKPKVTYMITAKEPKLADILSQYSTRGTLCDNVP